MDACRAPDHVVSTVPSRPSASFHVLTAAWALLAMILCASLGGYGLPLVVFLLGALLAASWCYELARALFDRDASRRLTFWAWASLPLTGLLLVAMYLSPLPYTIRVKLSEPALLRLVEDLERGRVDRSNPGRAGLIFVDDARTAEDCVVLTTESGYLMQYGLVFSRTGMVPKPPALNLRHLYGCWYTFAYDPF